MSQLFFLILFLWSIPVQAHGRDLRIDRGVSWEGRMIDEVNFDEDGPYSEAELQTLIGIHPGDSYQARLTREAVMRLYETGQFEEIWVSLASLGEKRLSLTLYWVSKRLISSIKITKNRLLSDKELIKIMGMKPGEWFNQEVFDQGVIDIRSRYQKEGYFQVKLSPKMVASQGKKKGLDILLNVQEGGRTKIRDLLFLGETHFPDWRLGLKIYSNKGEYYRFDEFQKDIKRLEKFYEKKGYFRAVIGPGAASYVEKTNEVDLKISIQTFGRIDVFFEGKDLLSRRDLERLILIKKERSSGLGVLEGSARQITRFYLGEGYPFARTSYRLKTFPKENRSEVYFRIESGPRVVVKAVQFSGNDVLSSHALQKRISLKESRLFSKVYYTKKAVEEDLDALISLYKEEGFESVSAKSEVIFNSTPSSADIRFVVDEGPRTRIRPVQFSGNKILNHDDLKKVTAILPQTPFTPEKVRQGRRALLSAYSKRGYLNADISPELHISLDQTEATLTYHIAEGEKIHFGPINLVGNQNTRDYVIMRELVVRRGEPYDPGTILESQRRLYKTGHFSSVRFDPLQIEKGAAGQGGKPIERGIQLTVVEKPRVALEFGAGYGNREQIRGFFEVSHQNLWGTGRSITARAERSTIEEKYFLVYREPWFFGESITARVIASYLDIEEVSFDLETFSVVLGVDKAFSNRLTGALFYQIERNQTTDVAQSTKLISRDEDFVIGSLNPSLIYDTRDDPFNPKSGSVSSAVFQNAAKILGSEVQLVKLILQRRSFHALSSKIIFAFSARVGVAERFGETDVIPLAERFFVGGRNTVRGYDEDELGIEGETIFNEEPSGGNAMVVFNEELRFSLPISFGLVLFLDHGNVWEKYQDVSLSEIKSTVGVGLRYNTPIGPLRFDWGFKLDREGDENPSAFHFTLGHPF